MSHRLRFCSDCPDHEACATGALCHQVKDIMPGTCHFCGPTERELRPYGPGGANICHPCMKATPEREEAAAAAFGALLEGAEAVSPLGVAVIGQESGPQPFDVGEIRGS